MSAEKDPLEFLTNAWRNVDPPAIDGDDDAIDAETRAAIATMRRAWRAMRVDIPPIAARRSHPILRRFAAVAAALVLLFTSIGIAVLPKDAGSIARNVASTDGAISKRSAPPSVSSSANVEISAPTQKRTITLIEANAERSVLACGTTRLVLLNTARSKRP